MKNTTKQFTVNVGLNINGVYSPENLENTLNYFSPLYYRVETGQYDGAEEKTAILVIECTPENIEGVIIAACIELKQECIAYSHEHENINGLIYSPLYKGEKMDFDSNYFISVCQTSNRLHM